MKNIRYLNVNVLTKNGKFCNTAMIAARGTEDVEESLRLVEIRLKDYGMELKKRYYLLCI